MCSKHNSGITGTDGCGWPTFRMSCAENEWPPSDDCNRNNGDCPNERLSVVFDVCNSGLPLWLLRVRWGIGLRDTFPFPPIVDLESMELLSRRLAGTKSGWNVFCFKRSCVCLVPHKVKNCVYVLEWVSWHIFTNYRFLGEWTYCDYKMYFVSIYKESGFRFLCYP